MSRFTRNWNIHYCIEPNSVLYGCRKVEKTVKINILQCSQSIIIRQALEELSNNYTEKQVKETSNRVLHCLLYDVDADPTRRRRLQVQNDVPASCSVLLAIELNRAACFRHSQTTRQTTSGSTFSVPCQFLRAANVHQQLD